MNGQPALKWVIPPPVAVDPQLAGYFADHPVIAEILHRRGYRTLAQARAFLDESRYSPADPFDLPHMRAAAQITLDALKNGDGIAVAAGDEAGELAAAAVLLEGLRKLSPNVHFIPPGQVKPTPAGIKLMISASATTQKNVLPLILFGGHAGIEQMADSVIFINPEALPDGHPLRTLGVSGAAYKFCEAFCRLAGDDESLSALLDLTALGIIADQGPLTADARYLAQRGITAMRTSPLPVLLEFLLCAGIDPAQADEKTISQVIQPRLNALARIFDSALVVDLLTTQDVSKAGALAQTAEEANTRRKQLADSVFKAAVNAIENERALLDRPLIYLESDEWPHNGLGPAAWRISARYRKPAVIVSAVDELTVRGSVHTAAGGPDMLSLLTRQAELLDSYGGNAFSAGFSLKKERLPDFRRALMLSAVKEAQETAQSEKAAVVDALLPLWELKRPGLKDILDKFHPYGEGNPQINFLAEDLELQDSLVFGKDMTHRRLNVLTRQFSKHAVTWWNSIEEPLPPERFDLVYQLSPPASRSSRELQINLIAVRKHEKNASETEPLPSFEVLDWRGRPDALQAVTERTAQFNGLVFGEGVGNILPGVPVYSRQEIKPSEELLLLTCPASYDVLRGLLKAAAPRRIIVTALPAEMDDKTVFMQTVTQAVLAALRSPESRLNITGLAAQSGQTERVIRLALDWMGSKTALRYTRVDEHEVLLERAEQTSGDEQAAFDDLQRALEETAAFKRSFRKANLDNLFLNLEIESREK